MEIREGPPDPKEKVTGQCFVVRPPSVEGNRGESTTPRGLRGSGGLVSERTKKEEPKKKDKKMKRKHRKEKEFRDRETHTRRPGIGGDRP